MKTLVSCFLVFTLISVGFTYNSDAYSFKTNDGWKEYKSDHFIIYYNPSLPTDYIKEFTRKCELYYNLITNRLGFNRFDFWLWDNRARIFLHKTREEYLEYTERPEWSGGSVHIKERTINTFYFEKNFFDVMLPHELAHIILREFIGMDKQTPLWFDEGVASANERKGYAQYLLITKGFIDKGVFYAVPYIDNMSKVEVKLPSLFYATAASLVIFLLEKHPKRYFVEFCRNLRDGTDFYEAMGKVYGIDNAEELNEKFLEFMSDRSYEEIIEKRSHNVEW